MYPFLKVSRQRPRQHWLVLLVLFGVTVSACAQKAAPASSAANERQSKRWGTVVAPDLLPVPVPKIQEDGGDSIPTGKQWNLPGWVQKDFTPVATAMQQAGQQYGSAGTTVPLKVRILQQSDFDALGELLPAAFKNSPEAYFLKVETTGVELYGGSKQGILNGLTTLEQLVRGGNGLLPIVKIIDWPDLEVRGLHIVMKMLSPEVLKCMVDRARKGHYNTLILSVVNSVRFKALGALAKPYAITPEEFKEVVAYARASGLEVVPQVSCLSHQDRELIRKQVHPKLLYNDRTYDPNNPKVYDIVLPLLDEIVDLIQPNAIHIGHDEVVGHNQKQIDKFGPILPAALYLKDVRKLNDHLNSKGVTAWMWGDMLVMPSEFPRMHPGSLNGVPSYIQMRDSLPRNIVICDWHYKDYKQKLERTIEFPTTNLFAEMGFDVLGAGWNVPTLTGKFSRYVHDMKSPRVRGMIATTWSYTLKGATSNPNASDHYEAVDRIIGTSAESFWNASQVNN